MISGYWISQAIYVAAKLKIADQLANGPQTAIQLAVTTKTHGPSLYRLLRALASVDLTMMVLPGGKERTAEEYRVLLEASGFTLSRVVPTSSDVSIIEGRKDG